MDHNNERPPRFLIELRDACNVWGKLAAVLSALSAVALLVCLLIGNSSGAVLSGFLAFMLGMMSLGNYALYRMITRDLNAQESARHSTDEVDR